MVYLLERGAWILWALWIGRNAMIFREEHSDPRGVLAVADNLFNDCLRALQPESSSLRATPAPVQWQHPPANVIKINFDGAFHKVSGSGVGACVARSHDGKPLASAARRHDNVNTPVIVEALALREAIQLAGRLRFKEVIFEGDAKGIIEAMRSGARTDLACDVILHDCRILCQSFALVSFSFVRRSGNWVAHSLAKKALRDVSFRCNNLAQLMWLESRLL
ncbi:uncharacterized protein LOC126661530 [Mercurialis annua]|uniref:uncharacterized protein LOC126661530 n=1 Tax=Mercurialis annua TaxID=3986 RepID=UPI002160FEFA|nr:uncharacterized protein LOC126661530 [Mercurialis annua]